MAYLFLIFKRFLFGMAWLFFGAAFVVVVLTILVAGLAEALMIGLTLTAGAGCLFKPNDAALHTMFWQTLLCSAVGMGVLVVVSGVVMDIVGYMRREITDSHEPAVSLELLDVQ